MNQRISGKICIAICTLLLLAGCQEAGKKTVREVQFPPSETGVFRVMTYNIRYGTADDGENSWPLRKDLLFNLLAGYAEDVMGFQEALDFQVQEIQQALPQYEYVMVGRDDGKMAGESCAIFYRRDRFELADTGTFWFSNTPWKPASKHWGNTIPRICTWVRLTETASGKSFYVYNLHLDHQSQVSREKSTELLAKEISNRPTNDPYVVMGDFNVGLDNPAMLYLQEIGVETPYPRLVDTWQVMNRTKKPAGTFNGFKTGSAGDNIDHILVPDDTEIIEVGIDRRSFNGHYPSDHFPVYAEIRLFGK